MVNKLRLFAITLLMGVVFLLLPFSITGMAETNNTNPRVSLVSNTMLDLGGINVKSQELGNFNFLIKRINLCFQT